MDISGEGLGSHCAHCYWGIFAFCGQGIHIYTQIYTHAHTYMHAYICAHIYVNIHTHKYFRNHKITPITLFPIHLHRLSIAFPIPYLYASFSLVKNLASNNDNVTHLHNPLLHLKLFSNCFTPTMTKTNLPKIILDWFAIFPSP